MVQPPVVDPSAAPLKKQGDQAYAARDFARAAEHYSEALENVADAVVLSNRSATYAQRRRFDKALVDADKALKLAPSWPRAHHRRGHALFHLGRYSEAIEAFEAGLRLDPEDTLLNSGLQLLLDFTELAEADNLGERPPAERPTEADNHGDRPPPPPSASAAPRPEAGATPPGATPSAASAGTTPSGASASAADYREKGNSAFRAKKYSAAIRAYDEAVRLDKNDAKAWANRAAAQMALLEEFGKGMPAEKLRSNPYYTNSLGDLTQALKIDPQYAKAWARKGQLHCMTGEMALAQEAFRRGLEYDANQKECQQGLQFCQGKAGA